MADRPLKYRRLLRILKRFNVYEDRKRGKGSERMLCRMVEGRLERFAIRCHHENEEKPRLWLKQYADAFP